MTSGNILLWFIAACFVSTAAQFSGNQNFQVNGGKSELDRRRLSPQQQGHILSDIQQHQHRFQVHQNLLKEQQQQQKQGQVLSIRPSVATEINPQQSTFQQQFSGSQQASTQQNNYNQQSLNHNQHNIQLNNNNDGTQHPESLLQPQVPLIHQNHQFNSHTNGQPSLLNPQAHSGFLNQPLNSAHPSVATPLHNQQSQFNQPSLVPTQATLQQSNFQTNYLQQPTNNPVVPSLAPSPNPVFGNEQSSQLGSTFFDPEKQQQRLKELRLKQQIIDKHNQFVEKQYEKALKKAQDEHQDWLENQSEQRKKLYQTLYRPGAPRILNHSGPQPRYLFPEEGHLFHQAVDNYYKEHPTTTTTTTTTTEATTTTRRAMNVDKTEDDPEHFIPTSQHQLFKTTVERDADVGDQQPIQFLPTALPEPKAKPIKSIEHLDLLQRQYQQQLLQREDLLLQLKQAIAETPEEGGPTKNYTSREISLANGQTVQIIKTTDPNLVPGATPLTSESIASPKILQVASTPSPTTTTTPKPPKAILEELTKGVIPPGANFELLKHNANGGVEELGNLPTGLPNQKKVTFVLLEEQHDGSYKVQGVRGNSNDQKEKDGVDVDSILMRIKNGEIKLPPPTRNSNEVSTTPFPKDLKSQASIYATPSQSPKSTISYQTTSRPVKPQVTIIANSESDSIISPNSPVISTNIGTQFIPSSTQSTIRSSTYAPYSTQYSQHPSTTPNTVSSNFVPSQPVHPTAETNYRSSSFFPSSTEQIRQVSTSSTVQKPVFSTTYGGSTLRPVPTHTTQQSSISILQSHSSSLAPTPTDSSAYSNEFSFSTSQPSLPITDLLKKKGLFAMAKFLKQSGLDTILNETGPYTIFVPTDKAFRNLLIQLGGPEKAEEKFKENPRLLSGLLLHHVIPGAFEIKNLQDEMTGVSLAGTQLRVNQYAMQDVEWNEVKVTTINGAKILDDKQDIDIPQGIAHAVDRVMFPLPVGDIVQTLQSDRERRFTTMLRILFASGLAETLQGTKTYTLFAPVDRAFTSLSSEQLTQTVTDRAVAKDFVMRHAIPGTLYTSGMRYYQIKDSLQPDKQITLSKTSGRVKVNNVAMVTQNIPATNGVIHALDALL
ncbi:uncharacterized protein CBL_06451 [Carabus blaptoides fortunei]